MKNKLNNKILILLVAFIAVIGLSSCEDTTGGVTEITYYPILTVLGDAAIFVEIGSTYVDAGCTAELKGQDVTDQVITTSNVDTEVGGMYFVSYTSGENEDGFSATGSRVVYVVDVTPSIITNGYHTTAVGTQRTWFSSGAVVLFSGFDVLILQTAPGIFYISDFIGGYYDQHVGNGSNYAMEGTFELNADNTITPLSSLVPAWGDSMDDITSSSVDPVSGQITYTIEYAALMEFNIIIN